MQIFIRLPSGPVITLDVEKDDTIEIVKKGIIDKEGCPCIHYFNLYYDGKKLENQKTLLYYNIQKEAYIRLEINYRYSKLNLRIFYNKNILDLIECNTCINTTVLDIKKLITNNFKIRLDQIIIIYNDQILKDEIILKEMIKNYLSYTNIKLELFVAKKDVPLVKVFNDKNILITFNMKKKMGHYSSIEIKKCIENYYGLQDKNQIFYYEGGYEESGCCCSFYSEIKNKCKKIIIKENKSFFSFSPKIEVEIYNIFLKLVKSDFIYKPQRGLLNESERDENEVNNKFKWPYHDEKTEENVVETNKIIEPLSITTGKRMLIEDEEDDDEQFNFYTQYTRKNN